MSSYRQQQIFNKIYNYIHFQDKHISVVYIWFITNRLCEYSCYSFEKWTFVKHKESIKITHSLFGHMKDIRL